MMNQTRFDRIDALLEGALAVDPAARAAWLKEACGADETLRHEVEALLGMETVAAHLPERADLAAAFAEEAAALTGQQISHYRIEERLGVGGMGEVWRAWDELLKRAVALKFLPAAFNADPERVRRFEQEAKAASQLNHPNIIIIHEIGEAAVEDGSAHFIATEYVEGQTLRHLLTEPATQQPRRLSVAQALDFAIQIASALKAAHAAWIIHRDIKPENIMVRADGLVKVLDFGIAKLNERAEGGERGDEGGGMRDETERGVYASSRAPHPSSLTAAGTILGTVSYMSPEQARGELLDGRTDVFSLGLVLYEMLTGARLLAGATLVDAAEILRGEQEPLSLSAKFEHAPKELERIIRKMLRRDRTERYATASELLDDLNKLKEQLANRASRRLVKVAAAGLLLAGLFVVAAATLSVHETWDERVLREGHTAAVRRAVFSPDGRLLVSVGEDKQVIVWDFAKRERLATFHDHTDVVAIVAFSPDGKRFATGSSDQTVIVWDAIKLQKEAVLRGHHGKVVGLSFSPDGQMLASSDISVQPQDCATLIWRVGNWEKPVQIPLACGGSPLLFTASGKRLIVPNDAAVQHLPNTWDVATGQPLDNEIDPAWRGNAALSPDGSLLLSMNGLGEVIFVDFKRRRVLDRFKVLQDYGRGVAFSPDGSLAATGAEHVILWDAVTRRKITTIDYPSTVWGVTFSPDGFWLVTTHSDGAIHVWDVVERQQVVGFNEHSGFVKAIAWARDGRRIASAGEDHSIMIWDPERGHREKLLFGHPTRVTGLAFTPTGDGLVSLDLEGLIIIWDVAQGRARQRFRHPSKEGTIGFCLALSPDSRWIATSHGVYESATGRQVADFLGGDYPQDTFSRIYGVAFSADGRQLTVVSVHGVPFLCETETWKLSERAVISPRNFVSVTFASDGKHLVTGEDGGVVQLWTAQPLRPTEVIGKHDARIKSVAFSPDGSQVVSASDDKTIALWQVAARKLVTRIGLHTSPVYAVAFSPDGRQLLSGEHDHSVRLYTRRRTLWGMNWD